MNLVDPPSADDAANGEPNLGLKIAYGLFKGSARDCSYVRVDVRMSLREEMRGLLKKYK